MAQARVRACAIVVNQGKLLCYRDRDQVTGHEYIFVPGGEVEPHETAPEAAARETLEETGFSIDVDPATCVDAENFFSFNGQEYDCLTLLYRGFLLNPFQQPVQEDHLGAFWLPLSELEQAFSYHPTILEAVKAVVGLPNPDTLG